ncbi:arsenate reductase ArsC [Xanthobacter sediminis]
MSDTTAAGHVYNVLFLCTRNAARSIMAEAILNKDGAGRFRAFSAGTQPGNGVHPLAVLTLHRFGYPTQGVRPKSWDEFAGPDAPHMDFVITVCDDAAGEECPVWPGHPVTAHWGIENPALVEGSSVDKEAAFNRAFHYLKSRISVFDALPVATLDKLALKSRLTEIGQMEGASSGAAAG